MIALTLALFAAVVAASLPAAGGQAGCCVCTSCSAPALFACRDALDDAQCQTTCQGLGCSAHQFNSGTDCVSTPQCYGDCCDAPDVGCSQVPSAACTPGSLFFANSYCDGSSCLAAPPTPTSSTTSTITATTTSSATPTRTATLADTATATATAARTSTASRSPSPSHTRTASPSPTASLTPLPSFTPTPSVTPSPSPTIVGSFNWLLDDVLRLTTVFVPRTGATFVHPHRGRDHSLDLQDSASRFCTQAGLFPQLRLALNPQDCENQCFIGIFPQDSTSSAHIARLPALNRPIGTFDVLVDTVIGCEGGRPPTTFRMPAAVTYTAQSDCDGDGEVTIDELMLGVRISLGHELTTTCLSQDLDNNGVLQIHELIGAVYASLQGG